MTNERRNQLQETALVAAGRVILPFFGKPATKENLDNMKAAIRADHHAISALNAAVREFPELGEEELTSEDTGVIRWVGAVGLRAGL